MIPVIAIVGRPNTGKSTLFNRITRSRNALVADSPGVTRDRNYGFASHHGKNFIVIDTGGLEDIDPENPSIADLVTEQSWLAIDEADHIFWLVDGRNGLTSTDELLSSKLRPFTAKIQLLVNKTEGLDPDLAIADFHALGVGTPHPVSAQRGHGIEAILDQVLDQITPAEPVAEQDPTLKISVIGRPNVGKSTLINRMIGEDRLLTYDQPGTTRDSISIPFERNGKNYELIDTAGVRRRQHNFEAIEKYSVIKSLQAIENSNLIIAVIDASEALTDQDLHLLGITHESGKPLIIAVNKWDHLDKDQRYKIQDQLDRKLAFVDYASVHFISALHGSGVGKLFNSIDKIGRSIAIKIKSSKLTDLLIEAVGAHAPPLVKGRRIKLRYAHLGGHNPLRVIIHGNQTEHVPANYSRYLANYYRNKLRLTGIPVMIEFKYSDDNPYKDKPNILTKRQINKRRRVIRNSKK
jgi:GTP-binding protein